MSNTNDINIFEQATRNQLRFPSVKGNVTVEDLWKAPLTSNNGYDLDTIAKTVNNQIKEMTTESFVQETKSATVSYFELSLEILKHIIAVRLKENEEKRNAAAKAEERKKLVGILATKKDAELQSLSTEDIEKRLSELG